MPDASVSLGLNADEFDSELEAVLGLSSGAHNKMAAGVQGHSDAHDRLFVSSHRATNQIHSFVNDLLSGSNAAQAMTSGLMGMERAMNLPIGVLAGLAAVAVIGTQIEKAIEVAIKLREEIHEITVEASTNPNFSTLDALESRLSKINDKAKELRGSHIWATIGHSFMAGGWRGYQNELATEKSDLGVAKERTGAGVADKLRAQAYLAELEAGKEDSFAVQRQKLENEHSEKLGKIASLPMDQGGGQEAIDAVNRETEARRKGINDTEEATRRAIELEKEISQVRASGSNAEVKIAEARVAYAEKEADQEKAGTVEHEKKLANLDKEKAALAEVMVHRETAARKAKEETEVLELLAHNEDRLAGIIGMRLGFEEKINAAKKEGLQSVVEELKKQEELETARKAADIARANRDRLQLTLAELAKDGAERDKGGHLGPGHWARLSENEMAKSRSDVLKGDLEGAERHAQKADAYNQRNDSLKDSAKELEKAFTGALTAAQVLKDIALNTKGQYANR